MTEGVELNVDFIQSGEIVRVLGYEWVKPRSRWTHDGELYKGAVAIETTAGWLILARVEQFWGADRGGVRRVMMKPEELGEIDHE